MTGFGRTGTWFGMDQWDVRPDILTAGKGSQAATSRSGSRGQRRGVRDRARAGFVHGFTWSHNALGAAVGARRLRSLRDDGLVKRASCSASERCARRCGAALEDVPAVGDVRGLGLMIGIELVRDAGPRSRSARADQVAERVACGGARRGLLLYSSHRPRRRRGRRPRDARTAVLPDGRGGGHRSSNARPTRSDPWCERARRAGRDVPRSGSTTTGPAPLRPQRVLLTWELIDAYGVFDAAGVRRSRRRAGPDDAVGARAHRRVRRRHASRGPR